MALFQSFFMGGFECATHRIRSGKRLDLIAATRHDEFAKQDYERLKRHGMLTARDGIRWHCIETEPGVYDFSSALPMVRAAEAAEMQIIWDLCHYGWPDDLDFFSPEFVDRFAGLARAFAELLLRETGRAPFLAPINEISFMAWAGGTAAAINPFALGRGDEIKEQLVRAVAAGIEAIWQVCPEARIVHTDPLIHVACHPDRPHQRQLADSQRLARYESWDMIGGRLCPDLGGKAEYLDIIGVNYYPWNQWYYENEQGSGQEIGMDHPDYLPFRTLLAETYQRYQRPLFIAETSVEGARRPGWFEYLSREALAARQMGVPIEGVCWYPILNYPGFENDRHCTAGLWDYCDDSGEREIYAPLAEKIREMRALAAQ